MEIKIKTISQKCMQSIIHLMLLCIISGSIYAVEKTIEWSEYQGKISWKTASTKCEILGMRLPTIQELKSAYDTKLTKSWKEKGNYYWTYYRHSRGFDDANCFNASTGEHSLSYKSVYMNTRCVR